MRGARAGCAGGSAPRTVLEPVDHGADQADQHAQQREYRREADEQPVEVHVEQRLLPLRAGEDPGEDEDQAPDGPPQHEEGGDAADDSSDHTPEGVEREFSPLDVLVRVRADRVRLLLVAEVRRDQAGEQPEHQHHQYAREARPEGVQVVRDLGVNLGHLRVRCGVGRDHRDHRQGHGDDAVAHAHQRGQPCERETQGLLVAHSGAVLGGVVLGGAVDAGLLEIGLGHLSLPPFRGKHLSRSLYYSQLVNCNPYR